MTEMYRQGDVLLVKTDRRPTKRFRRQRRDAERRIVLAEGELTGHAHAIADLGAALWEQRAARGERRHDGHEFERLLRVTRPVTLRHEEHDPVPLAPGTYRVLGQREYEPDSEDALVRVRD